MDNLDAPQWADFIAPSPQLCLDDYFLKKHIDHEYREKFDSVDSDSPVTLGNLDLSKQSPDESFIQKTPIRIKYGRNNKSSSCRKSNIKETTYEKVLTEAMSNLQLSIKNQLGEKSFNKSCLIDSPTFKTPIKRVTRSMCAQAIMTPKNIKESQNSTSMYERIAKINNCDHMKNNKEIKENIACKESNESNDNKEIIDIVRDKSSIDELSPIRLEVTPSSTEHEISDDKHESEPEDKSKCEIKLSRSIDNKIENGKVELPKSRVVTCFSNESTTSTNNLKKKVTALTGNAWHRQVKRRMSITNQRRLSVKLSNSNKYVSMAEAVRKFHKATPQRFHTSNTKVTKTEQLRKMSLKLTRATSPALICKSRSRPVTAMSTEEKERIELEKLRQHQIKANPVRKNILIKPAPLKKVEKKMVTNPEPFNLTETRKYQCQGTQPTQEIKRAYRMKTVPSIISSDDKGIIVKNEEVLHFGIPVEPCKIKKKNTKIMPFSFEARNRELHMRKQEKLKMMQVIEEQKNKIEFHARPVPAAVKTPHNKQIPKENNANKPKITIARSLSFEDRYKQVQLKKEEKIKQVLEEERRARSFKAQKAPEFKPVLIKGRSRDNLLKRSQENLSLKMNTVSGHNKTADNILKKSQENLTLRQKNFIKQPMSIPFVAPKKTNNRLQVDPVENQENRDNGTLPKILQPKCKVSQKSAFILSELNTVKRARQRREFDEQIKKRDMEETQMRRKEEEERMEKERAQKLELRKMTEIKARPMPVYRSMNIMKSNKPLTDARSPAWAKRKGSIH